MSHRYSNNDAHDEAIKNKTRKIDINTIKEFMVRNNLAQDVVPIESIRLEKHDKLYDMLDLICGCDAVGLDANGGFGIQIKALGCQRDGTPWRTVTIRSRRNATTQNETELAKLKRTVGTDYFHPRWTVTVYATSDEVKSIIAVKTSDLIDAHNRGLFATRTNSTEEMYPVLFDYISCDSLILHGYTVIEEVYD